VLLIQIMAYFLYSCLLTCVWWQNLENTITKTCILIWATDLVNTSNIMKSRFYSTFANVLFGIFKIIGALLVRTGFGLVWFDLLRAGNRNETREAKDNRDCSSNIEEAKADSISVDNSFEQMITIEDQRTPPACKLEFSTSSSSSHDVIASADATAGKNIGFGEQFHRFFFGL